MQYSRIGSSSSSAVPVVPVILVCCFSYGITASGLGLGSLIFLIQSVMGLCDGVFFGMG